jgi:hypothetical protein
VLGSFEADRVHRSAGLPSTGWIAYPKKALLHRFRPFA